MLVLLIMYDHLKIIVSYDFMANSTIEYSFPIK